MSIELSLAFFAAAMALPMTANATSSPTITTAEGPIQGNVVNGVAEFLGIPYAAPPVGNLRWRPPAAHASWTSVLQTTNYGPICAQPSGEPFSGPANTNEDCLYLNIFTPTVNSKEKLPVMFWIHGGGSVEGESNGYDGSKLASQGHTVVVSINYRLGIFGFLLHPALEFNGLTGNYGILDQQFALRWVRNNIANFGGDPKNITIFGQSGGSHDVNEHLLSPLSKGLFQKAIQESGAPALLVPLQTAEQNATAFAVAVGCGSSADAATAKCLRSLPAATVMQHGVPAGSGVPAVGDGTILPTDSETAFETGNFNHVPIMNGSTEDEFAWWIGETEYNENPRVPYSEQQFTSYVNSTFSGNAGPGGSPPAYSKGTAARVLAQYPLAAYSSVELQADAAGTDGVFPVGACKTRHFTQTVDAQVPVYEYEYRDQSSVSYFPAMPGYVPLAYHTAELMYLFPGWHGDQGIARALNGKNATLSDQLVAAWTNFAWYGNPNGVGNAPWPRYTPQNPVIFGFDVPPAGLAPISDAQFSQQHKCNFWDKILVYKSQ